MHPNEETMARPLPEGIEIRAAEPDDAQAVLDYLHRIGGESDNLSFGPGDIHPTVEREREILGNLAGSPDALMLVAVEGGQVIGVANVERISRKPRLAHRAELGLSVRKSHWNRGLGTALARRCLQWAAQAGCTVVELEVLESNAPAVHLYEKLGFSTVGRHPCFFRYADGRQAPALLMHCYL